MKTNERLSVEFNLFDPKEVDSYIKCLKAHINREKSLTSSYHEGKVIVSFTIKGEC